MQSPKAVDSLQSREELAITLCYFTYISLRALNAKNYEYFTARSNLTLFVIVVACRRITFTNALQSSSEPPGLEVLLLVTSPVLCHVILFIVLNLSISALSIVYITKRNSWRALGVPNQASIIKL